MPKLDAKFFGEIRKVKDGSLVPEDEYIVFLVKDNALPAALAAYYFECERLGADQEQLDAVARMVERVDTWRQTNPTRCKTPDAAGEQTKFGFSE